MLLDLTAIRAILRGMTFCFHPRRGLARFFVSAAVLAGLGLHFGASAAPITVYSTGFEPSEGYDESIPTLWGQPGWQAAGTGGNGLITASAWFPGMGQQAYVGFQAPDAFEYALWVWQPLGLSPVPAATPLVTFSVDMAVMDSLLTSDRDEFWWEVYTTAGDRLITLTFNNQDRKISYWLENSTSGVDTGVMFNRDTRYHLQILMDYLHNRWSATLDTALLATNQPMTQTGLTLDLGDIDAVWV